MLKLNPTPLNPVIETMVNPLEEQKKYTYMGAEIAYKGLPLWEKIVDVACQIFNAIVFFVAVMLPHFCIYLFCRSESYVDPVQVDYGWKESNTGLFLFITGLKGHPVWAAPYLEQIKNDRPNVEVRIPFIPHGGNCNLDEATLPILGMVKDYIEKHPGKPICIIGTSNGARIAAKIETLLRSENVSIRVTGIAGVFFGTEMMEVLKQINIASIALHPDVVADLSVNSETSRNLIDAMREPEHLGERAYEFYAASNDLHIPNFSSCLPLLGRGERHHLLRGWDHMNITEGVRPRELQRAYAWMDTRG